MIFIHIYIYIFCSIFLYIQHASRRSLQLCRTPGQSVSLMRAVSI